MPLQPTSAPEILGASIQNWTPPISPARVTLKGRLCHVEPLQVAHAEDLYRANALAADERHWTYLPYGPFPNFESYRAWVQDASRSTDPLFFAIIDSQRCTPVGVASYLRITPSAGSIEVGHIHYSPLLQQTTAATEAMYLMMAHVFELGYRRYEWKCDALNAPSRQAALRLGFSFEGIFRQATVVKGRNRDTAWFSVIDREWPRVKAAYQEWLSPSNFDSESRQFKSLSELTAPLLDPHIVEADRSFSVR